MSRPDSRFRVDRVGFKFWALGVGGLICFRGWTCFRVRGVGFRIYEAWFRVEGSGMGGSGGLGFRVLGFGWPSLLYYSRA